MDSKEGKMPQKANQLPKGGKVRTPPSRRNNLPLRLALPIVAGGGLLVVIIGVVWLATLGRGSSGSSSPAQVTGQPKLAVDRQQIDFGKVPLDIPVKATFQLSNVGGQPLQILNQPVVEAKQGC
jgi:hypothetical protein